MRKVAAIKFHWMKWESGEKVVGLQESYVALGGRATFEEEKVPVYKAAIIPLLVIGIGPEHCWRLNKI